MELVRHQHGPVAVLAIRGAMISDGLEVFDAGVRECLRSGASRIVLEMVQVPFIDSAGLERIQDLAVEAAKRGGDVRACLLNEVCRDIFKATRLDVIIQNFDDRDGAVRSLL